MSMNRKRVRMEQVTGSLTTDQNPLQRTAGMPCSRQSAAACRLGEWSDVRQLRNGLAGMCGGLGGFRGSGFNLLEQGGLGGQESICHIGCRLECRAGLSSCWGLQPLWFMVSCSITLPKSELTDSNHPHLHCCFSFYRSVSWARLQLQVP